MMTRVDAERFGDLRRVLAAGAAEAAQREARDVVAALHRDLLDRVGHALDGDAHEARGELLGPGASPVAAAMSRANAANALVVASASSGSSAFGAEHAREELGLDSAEQQVRIGDRQRPAVPVARGPGNAPADSGPTSQPALAERQDRAAAGRDRVDLAASAR